MKKSDIIVSILVLGLVMLILIPLNTFILDFLLIINLDFSRSIMVNTTPNSRAMKMI